MASHHLTGDTHLNIARGLTNAQPVHKFGANPSISINTTASIWDVSDALYPWSAFDTAGVLTIPAVNASDDGGIVTVLGLDDNWDEVSETFTVSSSATVTGTQVFKRVYRAYYTDGTSNVGNINVQRGGTTVLRITAGMAQTLMAIYSVPRGYTAYLAQGVATIKNGGDCSGFMYARFNGETAFRIQHTFEITSGGMPYVYTFTCPPGLPEMTDIDIRAAVRSNNSRVTAAFDMILIPNAPGQSA